MSTADLQRRCDEFNLKYPPGTLISVQRILGETDSEVVRTVSNYGASVLAGHTAVVYVTDGGGSWNLDHVVGTADAKPEPPPTLWCCNILGPDDLVATRSYVEAVALAHIINDRLLRIARKQWTENDGRIWAAPAQWPHDAESHARYLQEPGEDYSGALDMARAMLAQDLGATGEFPDGTIVPGDEGGLTFAIGALRDEVAVQFGSPVHWFSMPTPTARFFAQALIEKADALEARPAGSLQ
jgi:hypothetical protein